MLEGLPECDLNPVGWRGCGPVLPQTGSRWVRPPRPGGSGEHLQEQGGSPSTHCSGGAPGRGCSPSREPEREPAHGTPTSAHSFTRSFH